MRLTQRDLKDVYIFTSQTVDSGYVGTQTNWIYSHTIKCDVQPGENKITAQIYGDRVYNMYIVICQLGAISECCKLSFSGDDQAEYQVVSVKDYLDHTVVLAEVEM